MVDPGWPAKRVEVDITVVGRRPKCCGVEIWSHPGGQRVEGSDFGRRWCERHERRQCFSERPRCPSRRRVEAASAHHRLGTRRKTAHRFEIYQRLGTGKAPVKKATVHRGAPCQPIRAVPDLHDDLSSGRQLDPKHRREVAGREEHLVDTGTEVPPAPPVKVGSAHPYTPSEKFILGHTEVSHAI